MGFKEEGEAAGVELADGTNSAAVGLILLAELEFGEGTKDVELAVSFVKETDGSEGGEEEGTNSSKLFFLREERVVAVIFSEPDLSITKVQLNDQRTKQRPMKNRNRTKR